MSWHQAWDIKFTFPIRTFVQYMRQLQPSHLMELCRCGCCLCNFLSINFAMVVSKLKGLLIWSNWAECAARTFCRKGCLTRSPKECWTYSSSLEDTPLALQLWALWLLWMHAATCLSARVSTNKEAASAALFLATAVCWIALASFSAPTWGKSLKCLGLSFSFSVLGCCGGWWLFVGAGMEGPFFLPQDQLPNGCVFWGGFVVLIEVASNLFWKSGKRIGAVIFYHLHHHHLQQHQYSKNIKPKGAPYEVYNLQEAPTTSDS